MVARLLPYVLSILFLIIPPRAPLKSACVFIIHSEIRILCDCLLIISVKCYGSKGEIMQVSAVASHSRLVQ